MPIAERYTCTLVCDRCANVTELKGIWDGQVYRCNIEAHREGEPLETALSGWLMLCPQCFEVVLACLRGWPLAEKLHK